MKELAFLASRKEGTNYGDVKMMTGGVGILVKEELSENVVEVRRKCD